MATLLELREKRAAAAAQAKEYLTRADAGEELSGEDTEAWERALADVDRLGDEINRRERSEGLDTAFREIDERTIPVDPNGDPTGGDRYRDVFGKWVRYGTDRLDTEERQLLHANFVENRAQAAGDAQLGGYTVPEGFWAKVTETMKWYGGVRQSGVEVLTTDSGNKIPWPTNDDTSAEGEILDENTQLNPGTIAFGQKQLGAFMYTSKLILASYQFLQDTGIDAEGFIARKIGDRLGRVLNKHFTVGTGTVQPEGLVSGASLGGTAAATTAVGFDDLVNLVHSVDVAYRTAPGSVGFMMHDLVLANVRKLKDQENRPLWNVSVAAGQPDTLLGYPIFVNNDMDSSVATTKKTVLFGNFRAAYVIRDVSGGTLLRLTERYADFLQVGFFGFGRHDGVVQDSAAVKYLVQP